MPKNDEMHEVTSRNSQDFLIKNPKPQKTQDKKGKYEFDKKKEDEGLLQQKVDIQQ